MLLYSGKLTPAQSHLRELRAFKFTGPAQVEAPQATMLKLHNLLIADGTTTLDGTRFAPNGWYSTNGSFHETFAVRQAISSWMEANFYVFTSTAEGSDGTGLGITTGRSCARRTMALADGCRAVCRPWLSTACCAANTWTLEIRPIFDKQAGRWYLAFNPAFVGSIHGHNDSTGFAFAPRVKISRGVTRYISAGIEYYANYGLGKIATPFGTSNSRFFPRSI